jgi:hypothetical protein
MLQAAPVKHTEQGADGDFSHVSSGRFLRPGTNTSNGLPLFKKATNSLLVTGAQHVQPPSLLITWAVAHVQSAKVGTCAEHMQAAMLLHATMCVS